MPTKTRQMKKESHKKLSFAKSELVDNNHASGDESDNKSTTSRRKSVRFADDIKTETQQVVKREKISDDDVKTEERASKISNRQS